MTFYDMTWLERLLFLKRIKGGGWISEVESVPYNYRKAPDLGHEYKKEYDEIVGGTIAWNQLVQLIIDGQAVDTYEVTKNGITFSYDNGTLTVTGQATAQATFALNVNGNVVAENFDKNGLFKKNNHTVFFNSGNSSYIGSSTTHRFYASLTDATRLELIVRSGETMNHTFRPNLIDLTLALGSTIADYVYTLEQSTAGSGVTWLKIHFPRLFDNGYQPFNAGSIKSVSGLTAHEMVGKNLFDVSIPLTSISVYSISGNPTTALGQYLHLPQGEYTFSYNGTNSGTYVYGNVINADGSWSSSFRLTTPNPLTTTVTLNSGQYFSLFIASGQTTGWTDGKIQVEAGSTATPYEPYESHTYPLDSSVTLRGKYVLDNGALKAVGDVWHPNDGIDRDYVEVDLGTLNWVTAGSGRHSANVAGHKYVDNDSVTNIICSKYVTVSGNTIASVDKSIGDVNRQVIQINDSAYNGEDADVFKSAMSGVYAVLELATPTTEQATAYENPQRCDSKGTEEYVGSELPVGHNTRYAQ